MKRLDFSKPVTRRLTQGSNDYTNPNTNPARPSRHVNMYRGEMTEGKLPGGITGGEITGGNYRGESPGGVDLLRIIGLPINTMIFEPFLCHCLLANGRLLQIL